MPTDQEMMTLAAITYRGINLVLPEAPKRARLRQLMDDCMTTFSAVRGNWKIVWGPADFNAVSPGFDDVLMYVAQSADEKRLAIAIRGTNPISITDWLFGDFMATHLVPWTYGDPSSIRNAGISASTAFGLGILQHLRWDDAVVGATSIPSGTPAPASAPVSPDNLIQSMRARLQSTTAASLLETIASNSSKAKAGTLDLHSLLQKIPTDQPVDGTDLKGFLRGYIGSHPGTEIYVTGHSKGAVLCSTLALWLADTRGKPADAAQQWNPDPNAPVYAYSFAGPTAGNQEFADHSNKVLTSCRRVWNTLDIVPHAFVVNDLANVAAQYNLNPLEERLLNDLIQKLTPSVAPLHYTQICGSGTPFDGTLIPDLPFPLQLLHQHLDSYLADLGLSGEMSAASLLAPVL